MRGNQRGAALVLLAWLVAGSARAQEPPPETRSVAVWLLGAKKLPKAVRTKLPATLAVRVTEVLAWRLVMPARKQKREVKRLTKRCKPPGSIDCVVKYGELLGTAYVLTAAVTGKRKQLELALSFVEVATSKVIVSSGGELDLFTWEEDAGKLLDDLIVGFRATEPQAPPPEPPVSPEPPPVLPPDPPAPPEPVAEEPGVAPAESEEIAVVPVADVSTPVAEPDAAAMSETASITEGAAADRGEAVMVDPATPSTETIRAAPQTEATVAAAAERESTAADSGARRKPMFGFGLHIDLLIPAGAAGTPSFDADLTPSAGHTATFALLAEGRFYLPEPVSDLAISLEIGWYQLQQSAQRDNANDPDFASFEYVSTMHLMPILIGPVYRLPLPLADLLPLPLYVFAGAGFVIQAAWSTTSYTSEGATVTNATQSDYGLGWYGGVEAGLGLGPGLVTVALRYMAVYTDLQFKQIYNNVYNETDGDTAGTSLTLGYRIEL